MSTPRASSRSKAPEVDDARRLPCLQTVAPAPTAAKQAMVETFRAATRRTWPPPVPTMSMVPSGRSSGSAAATMARTRPVVSSAVSPLTFSPTRKPAIWAGSASPPRISVRTASASSADRSSPSHRRASRPGQPPKSSRVMAGWVGQTDRRRRRIRRRSRSVVPPQIPVGSRLNRAWSRHSGRTSHLWHTESACSMADSSTGSG